ncbi:MAG: DNA internalization-related competence protein ComEC/Rec2 [Pseudomonadota bacterium]
MAQTTPKMVFTPLMAWVLAWLAGVSGLQFMSDLPHPLWIGGIGVLVIVAWFWRCPAWGLAFFIGWIWAAIFAWWSQPERIESLDVRATYQAQGVVTSLPGTGDQYSRFLFRVNQLQQDDQIWQGDWLLRVSWFRGPPVATGSAWQLPLRIKPARSYHNPGSWDYAGWLYHQGVRYTAYVRQGETHQLVQTEVCCALQRLRQHWRDAVLALDLVPDVAGVLLALTLGDRSGLSRDLKQAFAATGTSHLMAISGLHIGLAATLALLLVSAIWRRIPRLCARYPALLAGTWAGLCTAAGYAAISGFGLPAQRALVMALVFATALLQRRLIQPFAVLAVAAWGVTLVQPSAVLAAGFWLSFTAVAAIFALLPLLQGRPWWLQAILVQFGINLVLYPVLLLFGMPLSWLAPVINLLLVPLFGFVVVPLSLLGVLCLPWVPLAADLLIWLAPLLQWILDGLYWLADWSRWEAYLPHIGLRWVLLVAVILALVPIAWYWRLTSLVLFGLGHLPVANTPDWGEYRVTVLDVGQGLSVVVQTRNHVLVYDTGATFASGFNLADAVVHPFLREQGITQLNLLLLSHGDNDHAGAASQLLAKMPVQRVLAGEPERAEVAAEPCQAGQNWHWDGVTFQILHPAHPRPAVSNNASCVLSIRNAAGSTLLTGDIQASVERRLAPVLAESGPWSLVVAPHHGSRSSSSPALVQATRPQQVVYAVGALNHYGFPKPDVMARWQAVGAQNWRTDQSGALSWLFAETMQGPDVYRQAQQRYWHD